MAILKSKKIIGIIIAVIVMCLSALGVNVEPGDFTNSYLGGDVYIHFIDVGQGSSTLIQSGNKGILIDAGEDDYGDTVVSYLKSSGVEVLEYVIASHPHSDHIGGMTDVFEEFTVGEVLMPELSEINIPTTRLYEDFITYIDENDMDVSFPEIGDIYVMDEVTVSIMGPAEQKKDLNNMSLICKVEAGDTSVLVTGDAETQEMSSVYAVNSQNWASDILVMGHHGSRTSVYEKLLNVVDADIAVVSCGKDNSYGHPHKEALDYINSNGMTLYRTDYDGDIVFRTDGEILEKVN